jgi:hypothetical protein
MPAEVPWASRAVIDKENLSSRVAEPEYAVYWI